MVTNIVYHLEGFIWPEVGLGQQAYVDHLLPEEVIQSQVTAADTVGIPAGLPQDFRPCRPSKRVAMLRYKEDNIFEDSPRARWPRREGRDGCESPSS